MHRTKDQNKKCITINCCQPALANIALINVNSNCSTNIWCEVRGGSSNPAKFTKFIADL